MAWIDAKIFCIFFSLKDNFQQDNADFSTCGPQDGGFDTSAWGKYESYYPIKAQDTSRHINDNNKYSNYASNQNTKTRDTQQLRSNDYNNRQRKQTNSNQTV